MAAADEGWPGEHPDAWSTANNAAQRLTRAAATIVSNLHQVRVPTQAETQRVQDTTAELMDALATLNELEKHL